MKRHIKTVREHNEWLSGNDIDADHVDLLRAALDEVVKAAERYEFVRTLNVPEFASLSRENIRGKGRFDDLVDEMMKRRK